jgi:hypothetical protein
MVYVKYKGTIFGKFEAGVDTPGVFVVLDGDAVSCFGGKAFDGSSNTGGTGSTGDVDVDLKVLKSLTIPHPSCHIRMIFKFLYATVYNIWIIRCQHSKLARMKRQPNTPLASQSSHGSKSSFAIGSYIGKPPKPAPNWLSVHRKNIA